jgi:hypothetical protein
MDRLKIKKVKKGSLYESRSTGAERNIKRMEVLWKLGRMAPVSFHCPGILQGILIMPENIHVPVRGGYSKVDGVRIVPLVRYFNNF